MQVGSAAGDQSRLPDEMMGAHGRYHGEQGEGMPQPHEGMDPDDGEPIVPREAVEAATARGIGAFCLSASTWSVRARGTRPSCMAVWGRRGESSTKRRLLFVPDHARMSGLGVLLRFTSGVNARVTTDIHTHEVA